MQQYIDDKIKIITDIPKDLADLTSKITFLEMNEQFIRYVDFNGLFAHLILKNEINMIAKLNLFVREYNILISKYQICRQMAIIEFHEEMARMDKKHGGGVCMLIDLEKKTMNMMKRYY